VIEKNKIGLSILIPVYNYPINVLWNSLFAVFQSFNNPYEILFLDDCSTDVAIYKANKALVKNESNVVFEQADYNVGRATIRNRLAEKAQYSYLLFIDVDSKINNSNFLTSYWSNRNTAKVIVGGTHYSTCPNPSVSLRFYYGKAREEVLASKRNIKPYDSLALNNVFIERQTFLEHKLDESIKNYGHEDTKFGLELKEKNISILHIDNSVEHIGLEENKVFLGKTIKGVENFALLVQQGYAHDSKLYKTYFLLKRLYLLKLFNFLYSFTSKIISNNLISSRPSMVCYDVFKLYHFIKKMHLEQ